MTTALYHLDDRRSARYDAVIVGGGPAGLSAALVLGRARKRVLVVDNDRPANAVSQGVGGLLGHDRPKPGELRAAGRAQLQEHDSVAVRAGDVTRAQQSGNGFVIELDGFAVHSDTIVLAHGLRYDPPALPGIAPLWGTSVFHCPFCDGWDVRDRPLALYGRGPAAVRSALFLTSWTNDVVLCTDGPTDLGASADSARRRRREGSRRPHHQARRRGRAPTADRVRSRPCRASRRALRRHPPRPAKRPRA